MGPKFNKSSAPRQTARDQYMQNLQAQSNLNSRYEKAVKDASYCGLNYKERMANPLWYQQSCGDLPSPIGAYTNHLGQIVNQYARPLNSPTSYSNYQSISDDDDDYNNLLNQFREAQIIAEYEAKLREEQELRKKLEEELRQKAEQEAKLKAEQEAKLKAEQEAKLKAIEEREELVRQKREQEILQQSIETNANAFANSKILKTENYIRQSHTVFENILAQYLEITDVDNYIKKNILDQYLNLLNTSDFDTLNKFYKELKSHTNNKNTSQIISTITQANLSTTYLLKLEKKCPADIIVKIAYEYIKLASHINPEIV